MKHISKVEPGMKNQVEGFAYRDVVLKRSHWEQQRRDVVELYLGIDNEDLMRYFRDVAGLPSSADGLMGWYGADACTFGQLLGAFAKLYLVTKDVRLRDKAVWLADEWGKCAQACERVYDINGTYVYEKLLGGFLDLYEYLDYQPAAAQVRALTESAMRRFVKTVKRDGLQDDGLVSTNMIEWYTLSENLYRAYCLLGDECYLKFAQEWEYPYLWDKLRKQEHDIGPRHAYSQVNSLSGAAMAYAVKGESHYLDTLKAAYQEITAHHMFATGGYGPAECIFTEYDGYLGDSLKDSWDETKKQKLYRNFGDTMMPRNDNWGSCEVSCCAWAVFKLTNYLMLFTKDAAFLDWAEKLLYNGTGGQLPITPQGKVMYYANYFLDGAIKTTEDRRLQGAGTRPGVTFCWQCCTGTFPQDVAEYANMLYYHNENTLYVAQYLPSRVTWQVQGTEMILENTSQYPEQEQIAFGVQIPSKEAVRASLAFRVPAWADQKNTVFINGEEQEIGRKAGTWLILERSWQDGDRIELSYTFTLRFTPVDEANPDIVALSYGPLVLAADTMGILVGDQKHPEDWIVPVEGQQYVFETKKGHVKGYDFDTRRFRPYYTIGEMEWYYMYIKCEKPC